MRKYAVIKLLDKRYYDSPIPYDADQTLVHELLHIKCCFLDDNGDELQSRILHQIINDLARAFVVEAQEENKKEN